MTGTNAGDPEGIERIVRRFRFAVSLLALLFGILLSIQYRSQVEVRTRMPNRRLEDLAILLRSTERANTGLTEQINALQGRVNRSPNRVDEQVEARWGAHHAVRGEGVVVLILEQAKVADLEALSSAVVHAEDLLKIINELRTGGAEAISLNGIRMTELTEVVNAGAHILLGGAAIVSPYRLEAIGPFDDMKRCLTLRGGVTEYLQFYGITVTLTRAKQLSLPAAREPKRLQYAKPSRDAAFGVRLMV